jgi:hypothetical protein
MIEFLQRLLVGHTHKWEEFHRINIMPVEGQTPTGMIIVLKCTECGILKNHKISS